MSYTLGVDIGGTKIAAGVVDADGNVVAADRRSTPARDAGAVVVAILDLVDALVGRNPDVEAVGVGVAGFVDARRATVVFAPNLGWTDEPLRDKIEAATSLPTVIENDANAAAWGEHRYGAGRGNPDMVMVTVGTGIGGGIVLGGELRRGAHGVGAEFGHLRLVPDGRVCGCGRGGCWEQYASGNALVREARRLAAEDRGDAHILLSLGDGTPEGVQGPHITAAAVSGDPVARRAFRAIGWWLGRGMAETAALLDPAMFVVGGGVIDAGDMLLEPASAAFNHQLVGREHRPPVRIVPAELGNSAGIVGAADLARRR